MGERKARAREQERVRREREGTRDRERRARERERARAKQRIARERERERERESTSDRQRRQREERGSVRIPFLTLRRAQDDGIAFALKVSGRSRACLGGNMASVLVVHVIKGEKCVYYSRNQPHGGTRRELTITMPCMYGVIL